MKSKIFVTLIFLLAMTALIHTIRFFRAPDTKNPAEAEELARNISLKSFGSPDAPIKVIEYTDFQCPACTIGAQVIKTFMERHPSQIFLEYRHYPIVQLHPRALTIAVYAECAASQGHFWPYHDLLFQYRKELMTYPHYEDNLRDLALMVGLDTNKLSACVQDESARDAVLKEKLDGEIRGVHATPTYFVNNKMIVGARFIREKLEGLLNNIALTEEVRQ